MPGSTQKPSVRAKRPTNLSLDSALLAEARALGINLSRAAESGLARAIAEQRAEAWLRDNEAAMDSSNDWVEAQGLPLARYRQF